MTGPVDVPDTDADAGMDVEEAKLLPIEEAELPADENVLVWIKAVERLEIMLVSTTKLERTGPAEVPDIDAGADIDTDTKLEEIKLVLLVSEIAELGSVFSGTTVSVDTIISSLDVIAAEEAGEGGTVDKGTTVTVDKSTGSVLDFAGGEDGAVERGTTVIALVTTTNDAVGPVGVCPFNQLVVPLMIMNAKGWLELV